MLFIQTMDDVKNKTQLAIWAYYPKPSKSHAPTYLGTIGPDHLKPPEVVWIMSAIVTALLVPLLVAHFRATKIKLIYVLAQAHFFLPPWVVARARPFHRRWFNRSKKECLLEGEFTMLIIHVLWYSPTDDILIQFRRKWRADVAEVGNMAGYT